MSASEIIKQYYQEQKGIIEFLYAKGEVSLAQVAQNLFAKSLVIVAASQFEAALRHAVINGLSARAREDSYVMRFCMRKGIDRQYHTWFRWEDRDAKVFYSLFGPEFASKAKAIIAAEPELSDLRYKLCDDR